MRIPIAWAAATILAVAQPVSFEMFMQESAPQEAVEAIKSRSDAAAAGYGAEAGLGTPALMFEGAQVSDAAVEGGEWRVAFEQPIAHLRSGGLYGDRAKLGRELSRQRMQADRAALESALFLAWNRLCLAESIHQTAHEEENLSLAVLKSVESKNQSGILSESALIWPRIEAARAALYADETQARVKAETYAFEAAFGRPPPKAQVCVSPPLTFDFREQNAPAIRALELSAQIAAIEEQIASRSSFDELSLEVGFGSEVEAKRVYGALKIPLPAGDAHHLSVEKARLSARADALDIRREIAEKSALINSLRERLRVLEGGLRAYGVLSSEADRAVQGSRRLLELGQGTLTEVLSARSRAREVRAAFIEQQNSYFETLYALESALGARLTKGE
ncbi:MAG: TolC family protein [Campylobacterales bacterium]